MKDKPYVYARTCVYNLNYHIVWCVKYRRKVLTPEIEKYLVADLQAIGIEKGFPVIAAKVGDGDHIHVFVSVPPKYSLTTVTFLFVMCFARGGIQDSSNVPFASYSISKPTLSTSDGLNPEDIAVIHILESGLKDMSSEITIISPLSPEQIKHLMTIAQFSPIVWALGTMNWNTVPAITGSTNIVSYLTIS